MRRGYWPFCGTQRGLTLVEVMFVLAISGLLLGGVWRLYHGSVRIYRRGLQDVRLTLGARTALRIMTRDIQRTLAAGQPHGIRGMNYRQLHAAETDRLTLTTSTYPVASPIPSRAKDAGSLQRIRYFLASTSGERRLTLKRAVTAVGNTTTERVMPLSKRLLALNLRYFDGQGWADTWQRATLPQALEITAVFQNHGQDTRPHRFTTIVTAE